MDRRAFESFSQNREDVVLWRALRGIPAGRYIDVGANHPRFLSVTMGFYRLGWRGVTVEPDPQFAELQRRERPNDFLIEAAITLEDAGATRFHVVDGSGLSTLHDALATAHAKAGFATHDIEVSTRRLDSVLEEAGWKGQDIHFMSVDTEGSERMVLESMNFAIWRPWILVIEATSPLTAEPTKQAWEDLVLDAGYRFSLFDGLSCFYVEKGHHKELHPALSYPACVLDDYTTPQDREHLQLIEKARMIPGLNERIARLQREVEQHEDQLAYLSKENEGLRQQVADLHNSSSWRLTSPFRGLSELVQRRRRS